MALGLRWTFANRLRALQRRWTKPSASKEAQLRAVAAQGEALQALMSCPGWAVVDRLKTYYQSQADLVLHASSSTEAMRVKASVEWEILEQLFRDVRLRIREGQNASEAFAKRQETSHGVRNHS